MLQILPLFKVCFFWLSDGEVPIDVRRPAFTDNKLLVEEGDMGLITMSFQWLFPCLILILAMVIWLRRRGR